MATFGAERDRYGVRGLTGGQTREFARVCVALSPLGTGCGPRVPYESGQQGLLASVFRGDVVEGNPAELHARLDHMPNAVIAAISVQYFGLPSFGGSVVCKWDEGWGCWFPARPAHLPLQPLSLTA